MANNTQNSKFKIQNLLSSLNPFGLIACLLTLLCSCEQAGDDYRYPSVVTDFACLITDAQGKAERMRLDDGSSYRVHFTDDYFEAHEREPHYHADTLYRAICVYELTTEQDDTLAELYSIGSVMAYAPTPLREGERLHQDPVYLQSIWLSGGFLNMVLEIKALNGKHSVGYVDTTPEGMQGKEFTFYHEVISDVESYRQKLYGSIPLAPFSEQLQPGDTLRFVVNTYDKGNTSYEFTF